MKITSLKTNALLNAIKQCCTIIFPLITFPYVSRVFGSESYGRYNFGYSYVSYFILLAALGIAPYAIREGSRMREDKGNITKFSSELFSINVITMIFSYAILLLSLAFWRKLDTYMVVILVHSIAIVFNTIGTDWINSIYEDFKYITIRYILFQCIAVILMFVFVKTPRDYIIYAGINVFANSGANLLNLVYTRKYVKIRFTVRLNLRQHLAPLVMLFGNALAVTIYVNSDITLLGIYKSDIDVGVYSVAAKIYNIIKQVLNAIIVVIIPRVAYYLGKKDFYKYNKLLNTTLNVLVFLIIPAIFGMYALAKEIVLVVGGDDYALAEVPLQVLCIALCFSVLACFFSNAILIVNKLEKFALLATLISAVVNVLLNVLFIPKWGIVGASITTAIAEFIVLTISIGYSKGKWMSDFRWKHFTSCIISSGIMMWIIIEIKPIFHNLIFKLAFSSLIGGGIYLLILLLMKNEIALLGLSMFKTYITKIRYKLLGGKR